MQQQMNRVLAPILWKTVEEFASLSVEEVCDKLPISASDGKIDLSATQNLFPNL